MTDYSDLIKQAKVRPWFADKHGEYEVMDSMFEHFGINDRS